MSKLKDEINLKRSGQTNILKRIVAAFVAFLMVLNIGGSSLFGLYAYAADKVNDYTVVFTLKLDSVFSQLSNIDNGTLSFFDSSFKVGEETYNDVTVSMNKGSLSAATVTVKMDQQGATNLKTTAGKLTTMFSYKSGTTTKYYKIEDMEVNITSGNVDEANKAFSCTDSVDTQVVNLKEKALITLKILDKETSTCVDELKSLVVTLDNNKIYTESNFRKNSDGTYYTYANYSDVSGSKISSVQVAGYDEYMDEKFDSSNNSSDFSVVELAAEVSLTHKKLSSYTVNVKDNNLKAVPNVKGAEVVLTGGSNVYTATTDDKGNAVFENDKALSIGIKYNIKVTPPENNVCEIITDGNTGVVSDKNNLKNILLNVDLTNNQIELPGSVQKYNPGKSYTLKITKASDKYTWKVTQDSKSVGNVTLKDNSTYELILNGSVVEGKDVVISAKYGDTNNVTETKITGDKIEVNAIENNQYALFDGNTKVTDTNGYYSKGLTLKALKPGTFKFVKETQGFDDVNFASYAENAEIVSSADFANGTLYMQENDNQILKGEDIKIDTTAPSIKSSTISGVKGDGTEIGDATDECCTKKKINIEAEDNESGIERISYSKGDGAFVQDGANYNDLSDDVKSKLDSAQQIYTQQGKESKVSIEVKDIIDENGQVYNIYVIDALGNIKVHSVTVKNVKPNGPGINTTTLTASPLHVNSERKNTFYFDKHEENIERIVSAEIINYSSDIKAYVSGELKAYFDVEIAENINSKNYVKVKLKDTTPDGEYKVDCFVEDAAGNKSSCTFYVVIDSTAPKLESVSIGNIQNYNQIDSELHTRQKNICIEISDDRLGDLTVTCNYQFIRKHAPGESVEPENYTVNSSEDGTKYIIPTAKEGTYSFYIEAVDPVGHKMVSKVVDEKSVYTVENGRFTSGDIYVDIEGPEISDIAYNEPDEVKYNTGYYEKALEFSFTVKDTGLDTVNSYYEIYKVDGKTDEEKVVKKKELSSDNNYEYKVSDKVESDGTYYIKIHAVDTAGNPNEVVGDKKVISVVGPSIYNFQYIPDQGTSTYKRNGITYYNGPITISFSIDDEIAHTAGALIGDDGRENNMDPYVHDARGEYYDGYKDGTDYKIHCDSYCIPSYFYGVDNNLYGGSHKKKDENTKFCIDGENPTLKSEIKYVSASDNSEITPLDDARQYHIFSQQKLKVVFTAYDGYSGLNRLVVTRTDNIEETTILNNANEQEIEIVVNPDYKDKIKFTLYDNAENSSSYETKNMVIESDQKHSESYRGTITELNQPNAAGFYNSDIAVRCEASENYSGIKKVDYKIGNSISGTFDAGENQEVYNWSQDFVISAQDNNQNEVTATFTVTDNTGRTETVSKTYKIDVSSPILKVSYNNDEVINQKYYNRSRIATIIIDEMNLDLDNTKIEVTKDGNPVDVRASFTTDGMVRTTAEGVAYYEYVMNYAFDEDGDYTFNVKTSDTAGNYAEYGKIDSFTIDMTTPVVTIDMNGSASNGSYYSEARTAIITVREHNFNADDFNIEISATNENQPVAAPALSAFTKSDDVYTATVQFNTDAVFTVSASYTDLAGNSAEGIKQQQFTVDLTDPSIVIEGLEGDKTYGKSDKVAPKFTVTDTNLDPSSVTIQLTGSDHGVIDLPCKTDATTNGFVYTLPDIADDDIYTIKAYAKDLSGRTKTIDTNFKINRNGSVFKLGNATQILNSDKYVKAVDKDLIITEKNISQVTSENISYSHGGTLVGLNNEKDYTVSANVDNLGWNEYTYSIDHNLFKEEGNYKLSINTTDALGNNSENASKAADIEFIVDNTAPTCVVTGVEDNGTYREDYVDVTIEVYDNIAIDSIDVILNDNATKYTENDLVDGKLNITVPSSAAEQTLTVKCSDYAGNNADVEKYKFTVSKDVIASTANKIFSQPIFWVVGGVSVAGVAAGTTAAVFRKRRFKVK